MSKNLINNKTAKGLVSLITIIILMSSILAVTIYHQEYQNQITGKVTGMGGVSGFDETFDRLLEE